MRDHNLVWEVSVSLDDSSKATLAGGSILDWILTIPIHSTTVRTAGWLKFLHGRKLFLCFDGRSGFEGSIAKQEHRNAVHAGTLFDSMFWGCFLDSMLQACLMLVRPCHCQRIEADAFACGIGKSTSSWFGDWKGLFTRRSACELSPSMADERSPAEANKLHARDSKPQPLYQNTNRVAKITEMLGKDNETMKTKQTHTTPIWRLPNSKPEHQF